MDTHATLRDTREENVVTLTLDAAGGNRISLATLEDLHGTLLRLRDDASVRALVLRAENEDFSLGADLRDPRLSRLVTEGDASRRELASLGQAVVDALADFPVPTIVGSRGRILGAGACFFTACDFRFGDPGASLGFPEVDRAMHLSWGVIPRMIRAYGETTAKRLALLGAAMPVTALGDAVDVVADPDAAACALALRLSEKPPLAVRAIVDVLRSGDTSRDAALFASTAASADFVEAMLAFAQKRTPSFRGR